MRPIVALAVVLATGCYRKPVWTNNPIQSREGISVTLDGQMCWDSEGGHHWADAPRTLLIRLKIENPTDQLVRVNKDLVALSVGDDGGIPRWHGASTAEVKPHQANTVEWRFITHTPCESDRTFVIALRDAISLGNQIASLADLQFKP